MLTNWIIAIYLLVRYKLRFNPFCKFGSGSYIYKINIETGETISRTIRVNPFDEYFVETFLHELGHHVFKKPTMINPCHNRIKDKSFGYVMRYRGQGVEFILEEETFASKFAYKASKKLKIQCSKAKLLQWFYTYTGAGYKYLTKVGADRTAYTDHVSKLINKLENA